MSYPYIFFDHTLDREKLRAPRYGVGQIECFHRFHVGDRPQPAGPLEARINEIFEDRAHAGLSADQFVDAFRSAPKKANKTNMAVLLGIIAERFFEEKRYLECIEWYRQHRVAAQFDPRFYFFCAKSMISMDNNGFAVEACDELLRAMPARKYIFIALKGVALRRSGEFFHAAECFADAAREKYDYNLATEALGFVSSRISPEEARSLISRLRKGAEKSRSPSFHHALACLASRAGDEVLNAAHLSMALLFKNKPKIDRQKGEPNPEPLSEPHFLILGLAKCGTSSVYEKICSHPHVLPAARKELHYFTGANTEKSIQWYLSNFPNFVLPSGKPFLTGEATPGYFTSRDAFERIKVTCPSSKLLVIFRNPTTRTISTFYQKRKMLGITLTLEEYVKKYLQTADTEGVIFENHYVDRLTMWEEWRGKGNIHITCAEQMFEDGKKCMDSIFRFLDLDPELVTERFPAVNRGAYPDAPREILKSLQEHFAPWNERLFRHIGEDFGWNDERY